MRDRNLSVSLSTRKLRDRKTGMLLNSIVSGTQNTSFVFKAHIQTDVLKKLCPLIVKQVTFPLLQNAVKREK